MAFFDNTPTQVVAVKSIIQSKTVWGGLLAIASGALGFFGYSMGIPDQEAIISIVGGAIAIYGRIKASKKVVLG